MRLRVGLLAMLVLLTMAIPAWAQPNPLRGSQPSGEATGPDQPVRPQMPVLVRQVPAAQPAAVPQPPQPPPPPFTLTPQEEAQVDQALKQWEQRNHDIKTFDCGFTRWIYDAVFGPADQAKFTEIGTIKYAAPDRGEFCIKSSVKNGKEVPIEDARADHWICDGKAVYEYSPTKKQVIEHKLPKEMQGKAIANGPLPFLFGAEAKALKERYYIRVTTPANVKDQIWLEAYPRFRQDAANWHHALFMIKTEGMTPYYLKLVQPNEKDSTSYQFFSIVVDDPLRFFSGNPFRPFTPFGWQMIPDDAPPASQAGRPPAGAKR